MLGLGLLLGVNCFVYLHRMEPYDVIVNQPVVIDNVSRLCVFSNSLCRAISCFLNREN